MAHPKGESKQGFLRANFDRRLKLEFHGSKVTTDAGPFARQELDDTLDSTEAAGGSGAPVADHAAGEVGRNRSQGAQPWSVCQFPVGRGGGAERRVPQIPAADRWAAAQTRPGVRKEWPSPGPGQPVACV